MKNKQLLSSAVIISVIFIVCSYYAGKSSGRQQQAYLDAIQAHRTAGQHCFDLGEEVWNRMKLVCQGKNISIEEFEGHFGPVIKIDQSQGYPGSDKTATHYYTHPKSNRTFSLHFEDDVLAKFGFNDSPYDSNPNLPSIEDRMSQMLD